METSNVHKKRKAWVILVPVIILLVLTICAAAVYLLAPTIVGDVLSKII